MSGPSENTTYSYLQTFCGRPPDGVRTKVPNFRTPSGGREHPIVYTNAKKHGCSRNPTKGRSSGAPTTIVSINRTLKKGPGVSSLWCLTQGVRNVPTQK